MIINIFLELSALLGLTLAMAVLVKLLRQPFLLAYLLAGICAGPLLLNIIHTDQSFYGLFSEFGVVLLLFMVGLSLNFNYLKKIGRVAIITGVGQVLITGTLGALLLRSLGLSWLPALYLSVAMTFSSTIIITKLLGDKRDLESLYGRHTIGLMLVQDVIAILIMIGLTTFRQGGSVLLSLGPLLLKGILLVSICYWLAKFVLPVILDHIAISAEFLFLFTIAWCFGVASLVTLLGFSLEIGAIVAGLSLGSSPYQSEIVSRVKPLRDFFLILFFILLGSSLPFSAVRQMLVPGVLVAVFILLADPLILYTLFRLLKFTRRNSLLSGLTAAQVSEFGFVLLFVGREMGQVSEQELALFTIVALITIFVSSYLITYNKQVHEFFVPWFKLFSKDRAVQTEEEQPKYDTWIIGYHRIGWRIAAALKVRRASFAVIDFHPEAIAQLKKHGIPAYFGDVADVEFLATLPLEKAKLIISTIPEAEDQLTLIKHVRSHSKKPYIVANLTEAKFRSVLYASGASYVMMPHLLGGHWIAELIKKQHLTKQIFMQLRREQEEEVKLGLGEQFA